MKSTLARIEEHIVVLDANEVPSAAIDKLSILGKLNLLDINHPSKREEVKKHIKKATVLWVALGQKIDEDLLKCAPNLTDVVSVTTGSLHVDLDYLQEKGINFHFLRGEDKFLEKLSATAEHTWALLLGLQRKIFPSYQDVINGEWRRDGFRGRELADQTLGIIGVGRLGRKVASYGNVFGMNVIGYDRDPKKIPDYISMVSSVKDLIVNSDVISIHIHATPENYKLLSKEMLSYLKPDACLINTSRGEIIDEIELVNLLKMKKISGYGADVVDNELAEKKNPLREYAMSAPKNLLLTPHIGGFTTESRLKAEIFMAEKLVDIKLKSQPNPLR